MKLVQQLSAGAALLAASVGALAHQGHGMTGGHSHATDTAGFVVVALLAGLALWLSRGD